MFHRHRLEKRNHNIDFPSVWNFGQHSKQCLLKTTCLSCPVRHHLIVWEGEILIQNLRCIKFLKSTLRALQFLTLDPILREILNPLVTALYTVAQNIMTTRVIKPIPQNVYFNTLISLTLSWRWSLSYRNYSIDLSFTAIVNSFLLLLSPTILKKRLHHGFYLKNFTKNFKTFF